MSKRLKTGGRKPGSLNKITKELVTALGDGELPLDYMIRVMRDTTLEHRRRDDMARQAAPYLHPRLACTEVSGGDPIELIHKIERVIVYPKNPHGEGISTATESV